MSDTVFGFSLSLVVGFTVLSVVAVVVFAALLLSGGYSSDGET